MFRVGIGYDTHRLVKRRKLILGGVNIPFDKGLLGHSDADVLLHAICDALLGACGQGDIGEHFPDSDMAYKGISSTVLLMQVQALLKKLKFSICNIDVIVIAQKPKISAFKGKMAKNIAQALRVSCKKVNIKATTTEGQGPVGKVQAISAWAIALIKK